MSDIKAYIYMINNKINNKFYIGSTNDYKRRWKQHIDELNKGIHDNLYLQNSWNKYGKDNFDFILLEEFEVESKIEQFNREQEYLDRLKPWDSNIGYNISKRADVGGFATHTGEDCTNASITNEQAYNIKKDLSEEISDDIIISKYGISRSVLYNIKYFVSWSYIGIEFNDKISQIIENKNKQQKINNYIRDNKKEYIIHEVLDKGRKQYELSEELGCSNTVIERICQREKARRENRLKICKHCGKEYIIPKDKIRYSSHRKYCNKCSKEVKNIQNKDRYIKCKNNK